MKNLKSKWMLVPMITGALVLGSIALVAVANQNVPKYSNSDQQKSMLSYEEISGKALAVVDGTVTKVEMEQKLRGAIFEVEVTKDGVEYDLDMDAFTGEVLKKEESNDDDSDSASDQGNASTASKDFKVSMDEAIEIALKEATGKVEEVEIENEQGQLYYKIEMLDGGKEVDVLVDTNSGTVTVEDDDDDDKDDDHDDD